MVSPAIKQPSDTLDLVLLDSGAPKRAVIFARSGPNVAVARLSYGDEIKNLLKVRQLIEDTMYGKAPQKPTTGELTDFGHRLFGLIIRDKVKDLYNLLPPSHVRILILSDSPDLQALPWEFIQQTAKASGPRRNRSVVRVVSTIGIPAPEPLSSEKKIRVLFAYANPQDQEASVDWDGVFQSIQDSFAAYIDPDRLDLVPVREVTSMGLLKKLQEGQIATQPSWTDRSQ